MESCFIKCKYLVVLFASAGVVFGAIASLYMYSIKRAATARVVLCFFIVFIVSILIGKYFSRLLAVREYQKVMLILYEQLRPKEFVDVLKTLIDKASDVLTKGTMLAHLSNGYVAMGQFQKAHQILEHAQLPEEAISLKGLYLSNLVSCLLLEEKFTEAKKNQTKFQNLLKDNRCTEEFKSKSRYAIAYQNICFNVSRGVVTDIPALEIDFKSSHNELHKLEVKYYLSIAYRYAGDYQKYKKAMDYVIEKSGDDLFYKKIAEMDIN